MSILEIRTYPNPEPSSVYVPWITDIVLEKVSDPIRCYSETEDGSFTSALDEYSKRFASKEYPQ